MEFLGNVYTIFLFEKLLLHEGDGPVSTNAAFKVAINEKNCSNDVDSFDSFRSKFFAKVISCFKSFFTK